MVDYAEIICQAVDEIVSKRLESINYDNTITCSIVDIKDAKTGAYIVTDGSTNFTAYSLSTEYKVNDVVYITVPNNDFTKQKIIIGKQVTKDTTPFIFTTPFDTIVDVSTNLINDDRGVRSLVANNPDIPPEEESDDEYYLHQNVKKLVWEKDFENSMLVGFTRLGIQGQFRSWLKSFSTKSGDYGYRLILTCEKDNHETTIATAKRVLKKLSFDLNETIWGEIQTSDEITWPADVILSWSQYNNLAENNKQLTINKMTDYLVNILKNSYAKYELYLSATDMYGDPYNFQSYYQQEKVYDISNLGKIINMKLEFYQTPETFISNKISNQLIYNKLSPDMDGVAWDEVQQLYSWPEKYQFTREQFEEMTQVDVNKLIHNMKNHLCLVPYQHPIFETLLDPNLFDKDPYICVGYDLGAFSEEQLVIYSLNSSTYRAGLSDKENIKQAQLRWLHKFEDGTIKAISNETDPDFDFEVRWYRYELGHPTIDGYAGVNWKRVNQDEHVEVDLSKIVNTMKNYYLIYHGDATESKYMIGTKIPYKNGSVNTLERTSVSILDLVDLNWLDKHNLAPFKNEGFIQPNLHMSKIDLDLKLQTWDNVFKSQMIFHKKDYRKTDSFTKDEYNNMGCLHRVGFWELFTMGYIMYQYCESEYNLLRVPRLWKTGGDKNPEWTQKYANKNLYKDLGCFWPGETGKTTDETDENLLKIKTIITSFANSFGEWKEYKDPEDNWIDYRPADEKVYAELYSACSYLYEKTQRPEYDYIAPNFSYTFLPDIEEAEEKIKAVIIYEGNPIYSNILTFENERPVNNPATLDQIYGLNLWCADNSYGNYRIYNLGGELEDSDARNHIRDLECHFDSKETEASGLLTDATWIMWRIPASSTMLKIASSEYPSIYTSSNIEEMPKFTSIDSVTWKTKVPFSIAGTKYFDGIWSDYMYDATTDEIVSIWKGNSANGFFINPLLEYKIESFYSPSNSNNTITCIIYKNGVQYETQKEFTFGPVGNSGTDWSFEIDFDNNETALTSGNEKSISLTARLYDRNNKDVTYDMLFDDDLKADIEWTWYKDCYPAIKENSNSQTLINDMSIRKIAKDKGVISIPNNLTIDMNSLLYIQCKLTGVGNTPLIAILPVPIRKWISDQKHYSHVTGTDFVVYPSSGYPHYYNNPFKTHIITKTDNTSIVQSVEKGGQWKLFNPHNEFEVYIGNITDKDVLQPAAIYTANVKQYGVQYLYNGQICWTQPIFTMQNNYPSRALNEWDGKEIKIDYDNGTIIAPAIAAGKKNADNTFSGVMLGDWSANDVEGELKQQTGIYGFEHGAMSYAFKEDGSAFIGKSGFARIKFDGNESTIASESYTKNSYGMMINLVEGSIDILGGHQTGFEDIGTPTDNNLVGNFLTRKTFQTTGARVQLGISGNPYFKITSDSSDKNYKNIPLIEISNNAYFLQTNNFDTSAETGMKIDLKNGDIIAYQFYLEAGSGSNKIFMDSEATTYPLKIGSNFKVSWGGVLECQGAEIDEADITNADIDVATIDDATINNAVINDAEIHRGTIEDASISRGTITSATIDKATINDADINDAKMNRGTITSATIDTATINDAKMNRGTITSATINEASINDANINVATLSGQLTGTKWSITKEGVATFGNWSFNGSVMSNNGNSISLKSGSLTLDANGALNIFATAIAAGAAGTASFSDIIVLGSIDNTELNNTLKNHESRLKSLEDELVAARATIKSQASTIASLQSELSKWENHTCPTPDSGGSSGGSSGDEGPGPGAPGNNT